MGISALELYQMPSWLSKKILDIIDEDREAAIRAVQLESGSKK